MSEHPPGNPRSQPPSTALRSRVMKAYRRRNRALGSGAVMVVLLFVGAPALLSFSGMREEAPTVFALSHRSADPLGDLTALDHALQVAYARGASDAEVAPMWDARKELLRLIQQRTI